MLCTKKLVHLRLAKRQDMEKTKECTSTMQEIRSRVYECVCVCVLVKTLSSTSLHSAKRATGVCCVTESSAHYTPH